MFVVFFVGWSVCVFCLFVFSSNIFLVFLVLFLLFFCVRLLVFPFLCFICTPSTSSSCYFTGSGWYLSLSCKPEVFLLVFFFFFSILSKDCLAIFCTVVFSTSKSAFHFIVFSFYCRFWMVVFEVGPLLSVFFFKISFSFFIFVRKQTHCFFCVRTSFGERDAHA